MKNFVQDGLTIDITASGADIAAGQPVELSTMVVIAVDTIADSATGPARTSGVFTLPCVSADDISQGDTVYLNNAGVITADSTDNPIAGRAWTDAANGISSVDVGLNV